MTWIAFHHLVGWFKTRVGDLGDIQLLVIGLLGRNNRSICSEGEVDARVRNQVRLQTEENIANTEVMLRGTIFTADFYSVTYSFQLTDQI